jgi:two-component system phosphate regulon response regulator OmpR
MTDLTRPVTVMIVEDDDDMRDLLVDLVEAEGYAAVTASSAEAALKLGVEADIALVDHNLPGMSGRAFSQLLRERSKAGIIMVTAAGSPIDRVLGLELVADDYVVKPFEPAELRARIRAVLRRLDRSPRNPSAEPAMPVDQVGTELRLGRWRIDLKARSAHCDDDPTLTLTSSEFTLLEILAEQPERPIDRAEILRRLGAGDERYLDRNVDVLILRLRRKIELAPDMPRHIKTRRGKGYLLCL